MSDLTDQKILFFSPRFFSYEKEIKKALEELGANVTWFDDRPSNNFASKVLIRLNRNVLGRRIENYYAIVLKRLKLKGSQFDYVLFLNPESITIKSLKLFKKEFPDARFILYMWDSFQNRKKTIELLPLFDSRFTFDPNDAKQYKLKLRPLFYIGSYDSKRTNQPIYDLLFTGTAHSDRFQFINKITSQLSPKFKIKLFFYLSSKMLFWAKKSFDKNFLTVKYKHISFKSLSHKENAELVHMSKAVLDVNHPRQVGLTMRTLEVLGAQRKLITTNADVINYDFYDKRNILVIDRLNPVIDEKYLTESFIPSNEYVLKRYSIKGWITDLFDLPNASAVGSNFRNT